MPSLDTSKITLEHIPDGIHRAIAEEIGIDNLLTLSRLAGGTRLYILKEKALTRGIRDQQIINEFSGYNAREIALKYGMSEQQVRNIVKRDK